MKFFVTLLWVSLATVSAAAPKFAIVRVADIYRELPSTAAMHKEIRAERDKILANERSARLRAIIGEMQIIQTRIQAAKENPGQSNTTKLMNDFENKRLEAQVLSREFEDFRHLEERRIHSEMIERMRGSLEKISSAVRQIANERNFDGVFDTSGSSNTGVPVVLYSVGSTDLTADVIDLLDKKPVDGSKNPPEPPEQVAQPPIE